MAGASQQQPSGPAAPSPPPGRPFRLLAISRLASLPGAADAAAAADPNTAGTALGAGGAGGGAGQAAAAWFAALAAAGIDALQLREKHLDDLPLYQLARQARTAMPPPARLLVNGRADLALAAGADGVHLPADGVPAGALRSRFGRGPLIGVSTHRLEEIERARDGGADYVVFGPVYPTPGKAAGGGPTGPRLLARATRLGIPVYALGGVTLERFGEIAEAGAAGIAAIRLFHPEAPESGAAVARLRQVAAAAVAWFPGVEIPLDRRHPALRARRRRRRHHHRRRRSRQAAVPPGVAGGRGPRSMDQVAGRGPPRPPRGPAHRAGPAQPHPRPQHRRRLRAVRQQWHERELAADRLGPRRAERRVRLLRLRLAARPRPADRPRAGGRRRGRQPHRPHRERRGDRFHRRLCRHPSLAVLQRRRRGDLDRHRADGDRQPAIAPRGRTRTRAAGRTRTRAAGRLSV